MYPPWEVPSSRFPHEASLEAATTQSSSRSDRKRPRTTRARPAHPISDRMNVTPKYTFSGGQCAGSAALNAIKSGSDGTDNSTSITRCTAISTQPL